MKVFVIHMGTLEITLHGSKQNLANVKEKKYRGLGQKENLPLSTCNRFLSLMIFIMSFVHDPQEYWQLVKLHRNVQLVHVQLQLIN